MPKKAPPFWQGFRAAFAREFRRNWFGLSAVLVAAFLATYVTKTGWFAP